MPFAMSRRSAASSMTRRRWCCAPGGSVRCARGAPSDVRDGALQTAVIDHLNYDVHDRDNRHTLVLAGGVLNNSLIVGPGGIANPVLYRGIGIALEDTNPLVCPVVWGNPSAYSYFPDESVAAPPVVAGQSVVLVAAAQARNNARMIFTGSIDMFSDEFFQRRTQRPGDKASAPSGNLQLTTEMAQWLSKDRGVLRYSNVTHHIVGQSSPPDSYTITDDVVGCAAGRAGLGQRTLRQRVARRCGSRAGADC